MKIMTELQPAKEMMSALVVTFRGGQSERDRLELIKKSKLKYPLVLEMSFSGKSCGSIKINRAEDFPLVDVPACDDSGRFFFVRWVKE